MRLCRALLLALLQVWVVSSVWLVVVPWLTCVAWRLAFVRGFSEVSSQLS
jgi:hypothetical protein